MKRKGELFMLPEQLIEMAKDAMKHAYAPYSGYLVGAALLCKDGSVYQGYYGVNLYALSCWFFNDKMSWRSYIING